MKTIDELMCLQNKKVIVIGGAGHIGASACDALAELGAKLAVLDRQKGRHANYICDLKSDLESRSVLQQAMQDLGGLDILIHCAAYVGAAPIPGWKDAFERQTVLAWEEAMRVNLTSIFSLIQESAPILQKSTAASVILFSSIYGMVGPDMRLYESTDMANPAAYNASKGAVLQMTR
ncbi:MAG: SDR family NAD(P)-dependent oxidoreductase, partial [bacterium]|nr:SDR family NAD(P)-dependent oxidoreductase [bacterium]